MSKENTIQKFLDTVYQNDSSLILDEESIKRINAFFKEYQEEEKKFDDFLSLLGIEFQDITKLQSGVMEIKKQYERKMALQPGVLSECNYVETLARLFKLNKCLDLNNVTFNQVPIEAAKYLIPSAETISGGRYLYYNTKKDIFLFQYGNPETGDAVMVIDGDKIKLEFKERTAKTGEYDITGLYGEDGKLIISDDFANKNPEYVPFIEQFNEETNVIEQIGHNFNTFDEETKIASIQEYFIKNEIDVLISSTKENELIALTPDSITLELEDGTSIISTQNSEIRTSGRNYTKIFTPELFRQTLQKIGAKEIDNETVLVNINTPFVEKVTGRGLNQITRIKFNKIFFIKIENITWQDENNIIFKINDVCQLKPTVSMHLTILASKDQLKNVFDDKNV